MTDLAGKCALVTGSVQGIGLAIAEALAGAGARLAVHGLASAEEAAQVCADLERKGAAEARFFPGDLRTPDEIDALAAAVSDWGPVDILVNNAGIQRTAALAEVPRETWDAILSVNLSAAFHLMQALMPGMAERGFGRVVNIASVHGIVASKEKAPYVSAKFGLVGLSKVAALEFAGVGSKESGGVTVNCIAPGWTETAIIQPQVEARAAQFGGDRAKGIADLLSEKQPSGRTSDPSEIGALALWLCARVAHNVTGTVIPVDGGWTAQ
ncbi:SDR family NAD(P)-dependent oxidoreductase [Rhodalgimonas zhirmunskyi]|uniref:SDR family NAD(P)-dependent oxidoreductase n=1 Tax=Rhodalgimonas zhirmunskyi TaxID=2964767 RepID=A0AAJ1U8K1_9RHOB|nr:SDR family NAD(P)-dependent oxidoreductase [Rhodoalgimonas zhirmunskyi]MDQ2095326.1 SDR family NAD(P)-dependent oxidoreductase [Rhodoalgimonas zhirmunskyi]